MDLPSDQDLETPRDDLLDFITSQHHTEDQLDQVIQTYQAYTDSHTPSREVNAHITYHQASKSKYGSLVDRGVEKLLTQYSFSSLGKVS